MPRKTELSKKMFIMAECSHARWADLRAAATELDKANEGFSAEPRTVSARGFLGAYARARRLYEECGGK